MPAVVADANVLIAARLQRDGNHQAGRAIANGFDTGDLPQAYVTSGVVTEVTNYLLRRIGPNAAVETLDALIESSGYEVTFTPKADFDAGRSLFRTYDGLSLTDAVIVAYMERTGLEYLYSFDDDFDAVDGVTRLTAPVNPFHPES